MNKLIIFISLLLLSGCVAGDFGEERNRLYEMNSDKEIAPKCRNAVLMAFPGNKSDISR